MDVLIPVDMQFIHNMFGAKTKMMTSISSEEFEEKKQKAKE